MTAAPNGATLAGAMTGPHPHAAGGEVLGHPKGLGFLFATEMWERFSFYGMRALLVLYMVRSLLHPDQVTAVLGFATLRSGFEYLFGPLGIQPLASQIYGTYTGLVYLTPIAGGWLADRVLGRRRTVILGAVLMAIGHFMMAFKPLFLFALLALILGSGAFKPNISTQVGGLYPPGDERRDRAYSIFYVGINIGAFFSPLVCGTLGETLGWDLGFGAAGVGMLIGLAIYLAGQRHLPPEAPPRRVIAKRPPLTGDERRATVALVILCLLTTLFWAVYEQQGNTIALWADGFTDRAITLPFGRWEIPTTWFQAFNPLMIFAFTPAVIGWWARQAKRGREPSDIVKMSWGCFGPALANLLMALAAWHTGAAGQASWLWLLGYFVVITIGELYLSPIGLSLVSKAAPRSILSMMMGVWFIASFLGNFLAGWLGSLWSGMDKVTFFLMIAAISALAGGLIRLFDAPLRPLLEGPPGGAPGDHRLPEEQS